MKYLSIITIIYLVISFLPFKAFSQTFSSVAPEKREMVANTMLLYQRSNGGWPKHLKGKAINYLVAPSEADIKVIKSAYKSGIDATIDNKATTKEIRFLAALYKEKKNETYLKAIESGINYLIAAQYPNGGWPQYYPDSSGYRHLITYNDNAMINVLNLMQDVADGEANMDIVSEELKAKASKAIEKGIACILNTQIRVNGKLTVWCAQHDEKTLAPAKARAFELVSLSGSESADIVKFLLTQPKPSEAIKNSIQSAVDWFQKSQIPGFKVENHVLVPESGSRVWARFYDIDSNKPFFTGRDGIKKNSVMDIEEERRNGYAWYGVWPEAVLTKLYPAWAKTNLYNTVTPK